MDSRQEYKCHKCKDTGWIPVSMDGQWTYMRCGCYEIRQAEKLMKQSGISEEFMQKDFSNFQTLDNPQLVNAKSKALEYMCSYLKFEHTRHNSILISGQAGAGKTHLGIAISGNLMKTGVAVVYMAYRNAVTRIKQHMTNESEYAGEVNRYSKARVLYIDDFLKGKLSDADVNIMYEIINYRYMNKLPVIVSTEKNLDELIVFDEAVGSRLIEMCRGNIIFLHGRELNYRLP